MRQYPGSLFTSSMLGTGKAGTKAAAKEQAAKQAYEVSKFATDHSGRHLFLFPRAMVSEMEHDIAQIIFLSSC
jgi:hypothetical protein